MTGIQGLPQVIAAIGGLGTAAFGLVDATKAFWGGVNHIGFSEIRTTVTTLTPGTPTNALSQKKIIATLEANWFNGTDLSSQKAIAKSLIKLNLSAANASALAQATGVDAGVLTEIASSIATGQPLDPAHGDVYARFDLIITALLDEIYQRSDEDYRSWTRVIAAFFAVALSVTAGYMLHTNGKPSLHEIGQFLIVGILATPLAPIAKDLSTALATAVNTLQLVKK